VRRAAHAAVAAAILAAGGLHAQQSAPERFRVERPIVTDGSGPRRLAIDVPLLAGAEPGFRDMRIFDQTGDQVPYLLLQSPPREPQWDTGTLLALATTDETSGFEVDFHSAKTIDAVRVVGLPAPFLKRLTLEGSGDRARWTLLSGEGTLFDLPEEGLRQTELRFAPGAFRYVRVTWDDTNSGRVPMPAGVDARVVQAMLPPPRLTAALSFERRPSEPGRSRYRVRLPAPRLPIVAVELSARGGYVFREASVSESRLSGVDAQPAELGRARLIRVVRDGIAAGVLRVPIAAPSEAALDLVIEDGSNPPLELTGVTAEFAELPWIFLEAPAGPIVARYGNPLAARPSYDLEAVRDSIDVRSLKDATWGAPRPLVESAPAAIPASTPQTGPAVDVELFTHSHAIPDGPAGLAAVLLDAGALAHSRGPTGRFADVRILDASNRQVPYIVERLDEPLVIPLSLETSDARLVELRAAQGPNRSTYLLKVPYGNLPPSRIVLGTSAGVFKRHVQLAVQRPPDRSRRDRWLDTLASATWLHAERADAAPALTLVVPQVDATDLWLTIDEGDNAALPITAVQLLLPSYRLRFYRPAGSTLRLVYGRTDLAAPQYDLALLARHVMGAEAREVTLLPEAASAPRASLISPRAFWVFLSVAALVLVGVIVRLVRGTGSPADLGRGL
jgi:hypothetical protein